MPTIVDRQEVQRLRDERDAQLVDVLPVDEYDDEHIAGAINVPLKQLNATTVRASRSMTSSVESPRWAT